jgi:hypothetical protein
LISSASVFHRYPSCCSPVFLIPAAHHHSAKLLNGTKQRLSGFSQPRQCGDEVLRILVTGGPPIRGGGGMPSA